MIEKLGSEQTAEAKKILHERLQGLLTQLKESDAKAIPILAALRKKSDELKPIHEECKEINNMIFKVITVLRDLGDRSVKHAPYSDRIREARAL